MKYLKTKKIAILLLATQAGVLFAAASEPEQPSLWQRTKDVVKEYPLTTMVIAEIAGLCVYEYAAKKLGLPSIIIPGVVWTKDAARSLYDNMTLENLTSVGKNVGNRCIETIKTDLITGSGAEQVDPSITNHLLYALRLSIYSSPMIKLIVRDSIFKQEESEEPHDVQVMDKMNAHLSKMRMLVYSPILEELVFTYGAKKIMGKDSAIVAPIIFGLAHKQYSVQGWIMLGLLSYAHHRSLQLRPEYLYAPIINHMLHNALSSWYVQNRLSSKKNSRIVPMASLLEEASSVQEPAKEN